MRVWLTSKRFWGILGGLILIILCIGFLFFSVVSYPSTKTLANRYVAAILDGNIEAALEVGDSSGDCRLVLRESAQRDIEKFGNAEVRRMLIETKYNDGSDGSIEFALVKFDYRKFGQETWLKGEMYLITDHAVPGFRRLCENSITD